MKIDLAVWTAVDGYEWQPGSVFSPKELASYKDEIGPLVPDSLPLGGLFLKDGRAVFYRVQIAERMDSRGRGAIYCVLGAVPEDKAKEVDFSVVFNSPEMAQPQKPFPTAIEHRAEIRELKSQLGCSAFDERRFNGVETFFELGGWCEEAKGGRLNVRITGSMDAPQFIVNYKPHIEPVVEPPKPPAPPQPHAGGRGEPPKTSQNGQPEKLEPEPCSGQKHNRLFGLVDTQQKQPPANSFVNGFVAGTFFGMVLMAIVWFAWPAKKEIPGCPSGGPSIPEQSNGEINVDGAKSRHAGNAGAPATPADTSPGQSGVNARHDADENLRRLKQAETLRNERTLPGLDTQSGRHQKVITVCPRCNGRGMVSSRGCVDECGACGGTGRVGE